MVPIKNMKQNTCNKKAWINIFRKETTTLFLSFFILCTLSKETQAEEIPFFASYPNIDRSHWYLSHGWSNGDHQSCEWRADAITAVDQKLKIKLSDKSGNIRPIGCGEIQSKKRFGYGRYEARMRTATGSGLNTAFFTFTGPTHGTPVHDEIDFEFLGKEPTVVEINYHRNGKNMGPFRIQLGFDASIDFHDYVFEWLPDSIRWYIDGKRVYETADGADIPESPGKIFFSLWSNTKILDDWMGKFKYKKPVTAQIEWVKFTPAQEFKNNP